MATGLTWIQQVLQVLCVQDPILLYYTHTCFRQIVSPTNHIDCCMSIDPPPGGAVFSFAARLNC